jgi:hypothetical protein
MVTIYSAGCHFCAMTEDEIIQMVREHFEGLFPKVCPKCGRRFETLRKYILGTERIGTTTCYDAETGDWETKQPIGAAAHANCPCGTTMTLTSEGMPVSQVHLVLKWIKEETQRQGASPLELINYIRNEIRKRVLTDPV